MVGREAELAGHRVNLLLPVAAQDKNLQSLLPPGGDLIDRVSPDLLA